MKKFKILNLHYTDKDGAGNAAIRYHLQFLRLGHDSISIVNHKKTSSKNVFEIKKNQIRYFLQRTVIKIQDFFNLFNTNYQFHNRGAYFVKSPQIILNQLQELQFEPDFIFLSWNSKFISYQDVAYISKILNAKIFIWIWDKEIFTGGCHYTAGCNGFENECKNCPAVRGVISNLPNRNYIKKQKAYNESPPTFIYTAPWMKQLMLSPLISKYPGVYVPTFFSSSGENEKPPFYIESISNKKKLMNLYQIPPNKLKIGFASVNLNDERKGYKYFKELLQKLYTDNLIDFHGIVIGGGDFKIPSINDSYLSSFGEISDASKRKDIYNMMDIFISTPIEDMGPQTLCEAMLCGSIPIGFSVGVALDVINPENGYLIKNHTSDELQKVIREHCIKNDDNKFKMSKNAEYSMNRFYDSKKADVVINELLNK